MNAVAEFFNIKAPTWDCHNTQSTPEKIDYILQRAGLQPGDRVLDIGTGTGVLLPHIARHTGGEGAVSAVDISPGMLSLAHDKYATLDCRTQFILADAETDPLYGVYDRIILYCIYPHLHHPLSTLRRLTEHNLAPDGTITIAHPTGRAFTNAVHDRVRVFSNRLPAAADLAAALGESGFTPEYIEESDNIYLVVLRG